MVEMGCSEFVGDGLLGIWGMGWGIEGIEEVEGVEREREREGGMAG